MVEADIGSTVLRKCRRPQVEGPGAIEHTRIEQKEHSEENSGRNAAHAEDSAIMAG